MDVFAGATAAICPLGDNLEVIFEQMCFGKSGIKTSENCFDLPGDHSLAIMPPGYESPMSKLKTMLCRSIDDSLLKLTQPKLLTDSNTQVVICSTKGEINKLSTKNSNEAGLYTLGNFVKNHYKLAHTPLIISNACVSGISGIINGARSLKSKQAQNVLVIGADLVSKFTLSGFLSFFATDEQVCRPYDSDRKGINLGEAAACIWMSSNAGIFKKATAKYLGGACVNDANHISGPSRTGEGLYRATKLTLQEANLQPQSIDYINAHGTATQYNDEMEAIAFNRLQLQNTPLNSFKAYLGHTLGAAGLIESAIALKCMENNTLLTSLGFKKQGTSQSLEVITQTRSRDIQTILKTGSGFGGTNAAVIFSKNG